MEIDCISKTHGQAVNTAKNLVQCITDCGNTLIATGVRRVVLNQYLAGTFSLMAKGD